MSLTNTSGFGTVDTATEQQGAIASLGPYQLINYWRENNYSEELRLASTWTDSWFNFLVGALYAPTDNHNVYQVAVPRVTRWVIDTQGAKNVDKSTFAQLLFTPVRSLEISAGLRYTHINEYFPYLSALSNVVGFRPGDAQDASGNQAPLLPSAVTHYSENNTSPEFTVTYRPTDDLTTFGSYKFGYKGPGYNATGFLISNYLAPNSIAPFGGEKVRGGELGVKARLLNHHLNFTAAAYDYQYLGLQVSHYDGSRGVTTISNGADAVTRGLELGIAFLPPGMEGLQINANVAYNEAYYSSFYTSPCYGGQTAAQGCTAIKPGVTVQNLTNQVLDYAPRWVGDLSGRYEFPVNARYAITVNGGANFSSRYNYTPADHPKGWQPGWTTFDAFIRWARRDSLWDVSLIGRNLSNKLYVVTGFDAGTYTPGVLSDTQGIINRPRQILLELTVRPN
jgi:outer membrane receptor protein involved in Fe transport